MRKHRNAPQTLYSSYHVKQSSVENMADLMTFYHFCFFLWWQHKVCDKLIVVLRVEILDLSCANPISPVLISCVAMRKLLNLSVVQQIHLFSSVQFSLVAQSCLTLCDPMNHSTPGLIVHHQFPEFTQTHVHWVGDAIQPSHPLSSPSPPAPNPSQHQDLFQWVNSSHQVAKVLEFQLQCQSFQWTPRTGLL